MNALVEHSKKKLHFVEETKNPRKIFFLFQLPPLKNLEDPESEFDMDRDGNPGDFQAAPDGVQEGENF